ncbi:hypothetical protein [Brevundimonas aveniformis]|uniref:hypothetical protein n=1 Tax=Brevundimonas aveniformis TaxID=370977 RepID=UPI002490446B|nr:hypothetical protein [Brevundimonas aveniformis]
MSELGPLRVTFDSNAWQRVVRPQSFRKDIRNVDFHRLHRAARDGEIAGFICETVGTLEAIRRADRGESIASRRMQIDFEEGEMQGGQIRISVTARPDHSQHPGLPGILLDSLRDAFGIGFRLLSAPRLGVPRPIDFITTDGFLRLELYAIETGEEQLSQRLDRFADMVRAIEARGVGRATAVRLADEIRRRVGGEALPWFRYLNQPKDEAEKKAVEKSIAEWADGDAVAAHLAYQNDVFCSEDAGRSAGKSILDSHHRGWLASEHGVRFLTLQELAVQIANR